MCGLNGVSLASDSLSDIQKMRLKILMVDNMARGIHSTGIGSVSLKVSGDGRKTNSYDYFKSSDNAAKFIVNPEADKFFTGHEIICHTRHATMGAHSKDNAHPFLFSNKEKNKYILGTHNGWLLSYAKLPSRLENKDDKISIDEKYAFSKVAERAGYKSNEFDVDSKFIFKYIIDKNDVTAIKDIEGAMALAFIYQGKLHLYRRESKPLFYLEKSGNFFYSSRKEGLEVVFGEEADIKEFPINEMWVLSKGKVLEKIPIEAPKIKIECDQGPSDFYAKNFNHTDTYPKHGFGNNSRSHHGQNNSRSNSERRSEYPARSENQKSFPKTPVNFFDLFDDYTISPLSMVNSLGHDITNEDLLESLGYAKISIEQQNKIKASNPKEGSCTIMLTILDEFNGTTVPLRDFRVAAKGIGGSIAKTNEKGMTVMSFSESSIDKMGKELELIVNPPSNYTMDVSIGGARHKFYPKVYYRHNIKLEKSRVLEVTLVARFREFEGRVFRSIDEGTGKGKLYEEINDIVKLPQAIFFSKSIFRNATHQISPVYFQGMQQGISHKEGDDGEQLSSDNSDGSNLLGKSDETLTDSDIEYQERFSHWDDVYDEFDQDEEDELTRIIKKSDDGLPFTLDPPVASTMTDSDYNSINELRQKIQDLVFLCDSAVDGIRKDKDNAGEVANALSSVFEVMEEFKDNASVDYFISTLYQVKSDAKVESFSEDTKDEVYHKLLSEFSNELYSIYEDLETLTEEYRDFVYNNYAHQ